MTRPTPASAFDCGPVTRHSGPRAIRVYLDERPPVLLGQMLAGRGRGGYAPDADLLDSIPDLAERWPRELDARGTRRAIAALGSWDYCRECRHVVADDWCGCDWCATCELRAGVTG